MVSVMVVLIIIVFTGLLLLYGAFSWGFVISILWSWFLVPIFPTVPELTIIQAAGLSILVGAFTFKTSNAKEEDDAKKKKNNVIGVVLAPWITLLIAWFIHLFY